MSHMRNANSPRQTQSHTVLPTPPEEGASYASEQSIYERFMRHLRHVPNSRTEIKILSAIQFIADIMDHSDAHVAKALVDMGLRAPRMAFPAEFLKFVDHALMRSGWEVGGPNAAILDLKAYWDGIGEDKFAGVNGDYSLVNEYLAV